jgi:hypothetical protein
LQVQIGSKAGFHGPYAVSKAALNTQAVQWHNELNGHDFTVVPLHPGWVATDMGHLAGKGAMSVQKSVEGALKITGGGKKEDGAIFFKFNWKLFHGRRGFNKQWRWEIRRGIMNHDTLSHFWAQEVEIFTRMDLVERRIEGLTVVLNYGAAEGYLWP